MAWRTSTAVLITLALLCFEAPGASQEELQEVRGLLTNGKYGAAETRARELLAQAEAARGPEAVEVAEVLNLLVEALYFTGKAAEPDSLEFAERALAIFEKTLGREHPEVARSLTNLGGLHFGIGDYAGARSFHERALATFEQALGPEHPEVAESLNNLALALASAGEYSLARPRYERALAIREKALGPRHPEVATTLSNLGNLLSILGDYAAARPLYERALSIYEEALGAEHPDVAISLSNLASLLQVTGDYNRARELYERALAIFEKALGARHLQVAIGLSNLSSLFQATGDYSRARTFSERALAIFEETLGGEHPYVATTLNNIGVLLGRMGDPTGARPLFERSRAILAKSLGPEHPHVATTLHHLANVEEATGEHTAARSHYEHALKIREESLGSHHPAVAQSLNHLAKLLRITGQYSEAEPLHERALAILEKTLGAQHPLMALNLNRLARVRWRLDDAPGALEVALRAETISREHARLTIAALPEREALRHASERWASLDLGFSIAAQGLVPGGESSTWDALIRSRAMVLDEMAGRHHALEETDDPELEGRWEDFVSARQRLANLYVRGAQQTPPAIYRRLLDQTRQEKEQAELALARKSALFRKEQARSRTGFADVAAALPAASALVAYALYDRASEEPVPSYLALVLKAGETTPKVVDLGSAEKIHARLGQWRDQVTRYSEQRYRRAGERLREAIWDPVENLLRGARRVFVVPDGELHLVNLAALPAGEAGYLVEQDPVIHYLSAERDLVTLQTEEPEASGLLALGGADFDATGSFAAIEPGESAGTRASLNAARTFRGSRSVCAPFRSERFEELSSAGDEVREVAAIWEENAAGDVLRLTGAAANETAFKRGASGRRVLHLATHGFFLGDRCPSALEPSDATADGPPPPAGGENPLLLSGLVLAGANHRGQAGAGEDDGILTAEEIAALDLSGVEWAVLSACDTGTGELRAGEGVFGLRRAFREAGARTLIMSLWKVDDVATRRWMRALYQARLARRLGTAEAVREASLEVLRRRRQEGESAHPFYWAAFVAEGDWK